MNAFFLERWTDEGNGLIAPLAREIARIGRALNRIRINGNPAEVTDRGIDLSVRAAASVALPFVNIFRQTSPTEGDWIPAENFVAGVQAAVSGEPSTIVVDSSNYCFWIAHDYTAATLTWGSGTAVPTNTDTVEYYRMLICTVSGSGPSFKIDSFVCPTPHDIHATAKST
jgi:hypothetical protein